MEHARIPQPIAEAVVTMLRPYAPDLTIGKLEGVIFGKVDEEKSETLLTRKETAELLNVSIPTIDRMLRDGSLSRRHIRGAVRIPLSAVQVITNASC